MKLSDAIFILVCLLLVFGVGLSVTVHWRLWLAVPLICAGSLYLGYRAGRAAARPKHKTQLDVFA